MKTVLGLLLWVFCLPLGADEARPLYVELASNGAQQFLATWRIPAVFAREVLPELALPADCTDDKPARSWTDSGWHWREAAWRCSGELAGRRIQIRYPRGNPNLATIFKATDSDGRSVVDLVRPGVSELQVPASRQAPFAHSVFLGYLALGFEHIGFGFDHLLFVACLVWIAGSLRRVLAAVTGFTFAHSLTLGLAALGWVHAPVSTIEVLIALSILMLAIELARGERDTLTWRYPVAVSTCFGLLHGFGFAAVLSEIGLPKEGLLEALFAFNLGIEMGQLLFVAVIIGLTRLVAGSCFGLPNVARLWVAYPVGAVATYWILIRAGVAGT